jgi:hypothetical protein
LNNQFFKEIEKRGVSPDHTDNVTRTGWKDDGSPMPDKLHKDFKKSENWEPGDSIPEDWQDF